MRLDPTVLAVSALTLLALGLRLSAIDDSLFADELILFNAVHDRGLGRVLDVVHDTESTPPLHFVLAWATTQVGEPTIWVRVPSLVLGTATVPLVYLLGARTFGRAAGMLAAALMAVAPFAIFYGVEARAYATLAFLVTLSTLSLLAATRSGRSRWWIAFALASCAALYTHYTVVFVIAAQIAWALFAFPERRRSLALATAGIALLYVPWIPSFLIQRRDSAEQRYTDPDSFADAITRLLKVFPGHPFVPLREIPGEPWLIALGAILVLAGAVAAWQVVRRRRAGEPRRRSREVALIAVLAIAAPAGVILYSLGPTSIFSPRSLISSLPAICVGFGALLAQLRPPWLVPAIASVLVLVGVGTVKTLSDDHRRPALRQVADYIHDTFAPGDAVLTSTGYLTSPSLETHLEGKPRRLFTAAGDEAAAWKRASDGGSVFLIRDQAGLTIGIPRLAGPENRFVLREMTRYPGLITVAVGRYAGELEADIVRRGGDETIAWSLGRDVKVASGAVRGSVDDVAMVGRGLDIQGFAVDEERRRGADWILAFSGGRLVAVSPPNQLRPDVAKLYGEEAIVSGFKLTTRANEVANPAQLRVFAVVGGRASELVQR